MCKKTYCMQVSRVHQNCHRLTLTYFAVLPVKADGEKRCQSSHIFPDNRGLPWAARLKAVLLHHKLVKTPNRVFTMT